MDILLSVEELRRRFYYTFTEMAILEEATRAQHQRDVEWLGGNCTHEMCSVMRNGVWTEEYFKRYDCLRCRAEFVAAGKE